jgi:hypothetical protein
LLALSAVEIWTTLSAKVHVNQVSAFMYGTETGRLDSLPELLKTKTNKNYLCLFDVQQLLNYKSIEDV